MSQAITIHSRHTFFKSVKLTGRLPRDVIPLVKLQPILVQLNIHTKTFFKENVYSIGTKSDFSGN